MFVNLFLKTPQGADEEEPEALSMAWPSGTKDRITYLLVAPIIFPLWLTLPDTRTPRGKKFFPITFIGSILWIAAYSYLMVWWANVAGDTFDIPPEVSFHSRSQTLILINFNNVISSLL
jgi:solute carrier family 24 (sodium/potassium/calcium exchanger), member 2